MRSTQTEAFSAITQTKNGHHSTDPYFEKGQIYARCVSRRVSLRQAACKCFAIASVVRLIQLYIANVDTSDKSDSYWVAFYFTKEQEGEFFDSYGAPASKYSGTFTTFLNNNSNQWIFNTVTLQSIYSKVCGHYCLYFALYRSRTIGHRFLKNTRKSDSLVKRFIEKHFSVSLPNSRTDVNKQRAQAQHNVQ